MDLVKSSDYTQTYTYDEAFKASTDYFHESLPASVFCDKYALKNLNGELVEKTPDQMHDRLAREFARIDSDKYGLDFSTRFKVYRESLDKFQRIVPQGSPMSALGNPFQIMSASNCVVVESPEDSIAGIMKAGTELAQLMKRRCGVGLDISTLRPESWKVNNAAKTTTGAWSFADFFSFITLKIGQNNRRGALMITLDVHHPDVTKFATMKHDLTKVTGANITIRLSDEFLKAVKNNTTYEQRFPCENPVFKQQVSAKEVWDVIVKSATLTAEPGLAFWDRTINYLPAHCYKLFKTISFNPCVTGDTWINTVSGPQQVSELLGKKFTALVDGKNYDSTNMGFFNTGTKIVYKLRTAKGLELNCTENHPLLEIIKDTKETRWTELKNLKVGSLISLQNQGDSVWTGLGSTEEGWMIGNLLGDGTITKETAILSFWGDTKKYMAEQATKYIINNLTHRSDVGNYSESSYTFLTKDRINLRVKDLKRLAGDYGLFSDKKLNSKIEKTSSDFYTGFLRGWFDADGSPQGSTKKGLSVRLSSIHLENLKIAQRMLSRLGIISSIYSNRRVAQFRDMPNGMGGEKEYWCQAQHDLVISKENLIKFSKKIGFSDPVQSDKLNKLVSTLVRTPNKEKFCDKIVEISKLGEKEVFDCQIPQINSFDANGITVHNCGEIPLSPYDSCRLIALNLTGYVRNAFESNAKFNWSLFEKDIKTAAQMCDNLIDLEIELIDRIINNCTDVGEISLWKKLKEAAHNGRRTGLGTLGLADTLAQLTIKYDSPEALKFADKVYKLLRNASYETSCDLAEIRKPFPVWDWKIEKDNLFIQDLSEDLKNRIKKVGRRNIAQLTQAPTGSISILSKCGEFDRFNVSSGVEPVFRNSYTRRKKINANQENVRVDFKDAMGDSWQEYPVFHTNIKNYLEKTKEFKFPTDEELTPEIIDNLRKEKLPDYFVTSDAIDWSFRVKLQGIEQKYIDHSISSTVNLPKGTSTEAVSNIYLQAWEENLKGITVYVDGSRDGVLITNKQNKVDSEKRPEEIIKIHAPKRPDTLKCEIAQFTVEGKKWTALVGLLGQDPYELFLGHSSTVHIPPKFKTGKITKTSKGKYTLNSVEVDDSFEVKDVLKVFDNEKAAWATRLISMSLRHGIPVDFIVDQLSRDGLITDINKAISRVLKKYIPEGKKVLHNITCPGLLPSGLRCGSNNFIFEEGCPRCKDCGYSKCN